jgi:transcriptional regulator with XRE-family HTH domain
MTGDTVARILCGANIPCGERQVLLAYPSYVGSRKTPVTGLDRAIGARIRSAREDLGVSITELGMALGSTRQKVQFWERGDHFPPLSEFPKLCQLLRTDANTLLGIHEMKTLTEQEKLTARLRIQTLAQETKNQGAVKKARGQESLRRRRTGT